MTFAGLLLAACGPDVVGTVATGAVAKQQELEQVHAAQQKAKEQLQQALEQAKHRTEEAEQAQR